MKKHAVGCVLASLFLPAPAAPALQSDAGLTYFGQAPPGDIPVVFAPGIVSVDNRFEQFLLYAPDGRSLVFGVTNADWSAFSLRRMEIRNGHWAEPVVPQFLGRDSSALTVALTFEADRVFFTASRPTYPPADIWTSTRGATAWSEPTRAGPPLSSSSDEWEVAVTRGGTLYFSSDREGGQGGLDLYRAPLVQGRYPAVENLGPPVNSSAGDDLPYIAPDESYLVFASDRPGGAGLRDLYISYRTGAGWSEPRNLGAPVNSEFWDIYPSVSPDGKYLFFTRRRSWETVEDSDIYWVDASFIERWRPPEPPDRER